MKPILNLGFTVRKLIRIVSGKIGWLPVLLARISVGILFIQTGWGKLHNLERVIEFFQSLGIPAATFQAPFVAANELVCGTLIVFGLFTRVASIPLAFSMVIAIVTAKKEDLLRVTDLFGMPEYLYILFFIWFFVEGAGPVSLDRLVLKRLGKK